MNRVLTTVLAVALLLGLGALAVLALPGASTPLAAAPFVSAAPDAQEVTPDAVAAPDATTGVLGWNVIALPLEVAGVNTADNVAYYISTGDPVDPTDNAIEQVAHWIDGQWVYRQVGGGFGSDPDFDVNAGDALLIRARSNAPATFAWVGDVPEQGSIAYTLPQGGWHVLMLPLDAEVDTNGDGTATADELGNDIGGIEQVAQWLDGQWVYRRVNGGFGSDPDFAVRIGYPYLILTTATTPGTWPQ